MTLRVALFDLDDTLYPSETKLFDHIRANIHQIIMNDLGLDKAAATVLQQNYRKNYGSAISGLVRDNGLDPDSLLRRTFPTDVSAVHLNVPLGTALRALPLTTAVFTHAPIEFVRPVLSRLGLDNVFEHIFDCRLMNFVGKREQASYDKVLGTLGVAPSEACLVEDSVDVLETAHQAGLRTIWLNLKHKPQPAHVDSIITDIMQVFPLLTS